MMIPRPLTDDAARHNPGRWICNKKPERCNGIFMVYGQPMLCPLRVKCFWGRKNTYEWTPGEKVAGRFLALDINTNWRQQHGRRLIEIQRAFSPEKSAAINARYRAEHKEELAEKQRKRYQKNHPPGPVAPPKRPLLPCGEDCEGGCPYDTCPYTDADIDALENEAKKEHQRRQSREKYQRQKAREAIDPDYKAHRRALDAARCKRYYENHAEDLRAKARNRNKQYRRKKT